MVMLAEKMRAKLLSGSTSQATGTNDEEIGTREEMQELLLSVGIVSPVTKESAGALYHQQLSRQLADFSKIPLERARGMINLIDIYCLFNQARGTEFISPDDLLRACSLWEKFDVPVMLRKFDSGGSSKAKITVMMRYLLELDLWLLHRMLCEQGSLLVMLQRLWELLQLLPTSTFSQLRAKADSADFSS
ncbi:hypothetical protein RND71_040944 [Anisodus tanguticus]|uniref:Vacuolar protein-sorting-associated protein 36 n=1 Tax=Anisodus tanguticus TaxID=243964 RepID=A0AAE1QWP5_9SOLA|nr:hypothetical protein RND71_040944 [Anisodus tanguticus]